MVWSWIPSPVAWHSSCTHRPRSRLPGLRKPSFRISFLMWPLEMCHSGSIRWWTGAIGSRSSRFMITFSQNPWIWCGQAAWWPLSPAAIPWIRGVPMYADTWPNGRSFWERYAFPTPPFGAREPVSPVTSFFYGNGNVRRCRSRNGCLPEKPKMD